MIIVYLNTADADLASLRAIDLTNPSIYQQPPKYKMNHHSVVEKNK